MAAAPPAAGHFGGNRTWELTWAWWGHPHRHPELSTQTDTHPCVHTRAQFANSHVDVGCRMRRQNACSCPCIQNACARSGTCTHSGTCTGTGINKRPGVQQPRAHAGWEQTHISMFVTAGINSACFVAFDTKRCRKSPSHGASQTLNPTRKKERKRGKPKKAVGLNHKKKKQKKTAL